MRRSEFERPSGIHLRDRAMVVWLRTKKHYNDSLSRSFSTFGRISRNGSADQTLPSGRRRRSPFRLKESSRIYLQYSFEWGRPSQMARELQPCVNIEAFDSESVYTLKSLCTLQQCVSCRQARSPSTSYLMSQNRILQRCDNALSLLELQLQAVFDHRSRQQTQGASSLHDRDSCCVKRSTQVMRAEYRCMS